MPDVNLYYTLALLVFLVVIAVVLVRYVTNTVDGEFRRLARATTDPAFRREELARVDAILTGRALLPAGTPPLAKPRPGGGLAGAAPAVLMTIAVALLWGSAAAPAGERTRWLAGGGAAALAALAILGLTFRSRQQRTTARLLRRRADLRRLDGDAAGAAADLRVLLALTPWDDASWAELADDLAGLGDFPAAFAAAGEARRLDPDYDEYRLLALSLALRMGDAARARAALADWEGLEAAGQADPRRALYRAAVELAEGRREQAEAELAKAEQAGAELDLAGAAGGLLAAAPELGGVLDLLAEAEERLEAEREAEGKREAAATHSHGGS